MHIKQFEESDDGVSPYVRGVTFFVKEVEGKEPDKDRADNSHD